MQADDSPQPLAALTLLEKTGEYTFDFSLDSPRLRPMFFGSRSNQTFEEHHHSFLLVRYLMRDGEGRNSTRYVIALQLRKH